MKFNLNEIKNLMQGDNNKPLPPELDWDNMKDGIFDKIQSMEQNDPPPKGNKKDKKRIGFFLLLFYAFGLTFYYVSHNGVKDPVAVAPAFTQLQEVNMNKAVSNDSNSSTYTPPIEFTGERRGEKIQIADTTIHLHQSATHRKSKNVEGVVPRDEQLSTSVDKIDPIVGLASISRTGNAHSIIKPGKVASLTMEEAGSLNLNLKINSLKGLPTPSLAAINPNASIHAIPQVYPGDLKGTQPRRPANQFILEGGPSLWNAGYGSIKPDRAGYEEALLSFQVQGLFTRRFKGSYFVMLGLQYQQLESKFQYNKSLEDYTIILEDTIVQIQTNLITGEQRIVRGDVEQTVEAERRVRHYNRSRLLKASIGMGKSWSFRAFQTDLYAGASLNAWVQNQGRTLSGDSVVDYNGASNSLFQNQYTLDGMLGVRVHYFLNPNVGLTAGLQTQKSLMNWSQKVNINHYPASFNLQLGLSYSLR
ncbi:MAG: hypothetical protein MRZ79_20315 [Bacteroidia bacterium]|nr:hypothetical protein [Bacteroidia bacterium]